MYNKLFTSILDSSIWLEPTATRIVWVTLLAAMDEDGFVRMATIKNLASRARVSDDECQNAVDTLESPDKTCPEQERQGRRIERVEGGWLVINSGKYREIVKREHEREQNRIRVARSRARKKCNDGVMGSHEKVTPSDTDTDTDPNTVQGARVRSTAPTMAVASASPTPTKPSANQATEQPTNRPTLDVAIAYFLKPDVYPEERFRSEEVRETYREFEASQQNGFWMWGKRPVGDWRSAMASRMSGNREKRGGKRPATNAADAMIRAINKV